MKNINNNNLRSRLRKLENFRINMLFAIPTMICISLIIISWCGIAYFSNSINCPDDYNYVESVVQDGTVYKSCMLEKRVYEDGEIFTKVDKKIIFYPANTNMSGLGLLMTLGAVGLIIIGGSYANYKGDKE